MAAQVAVIRNNNIIAYFAIMSDMGVGHKIAVIPNLSFFITL
jgi:hypothetical protein